MIGHMEVATIGGRNYRSKSSEVVSTDALAMQQLVSNAFDAGDGGHVSIDLDMGGWVVLPLDQVEAIGVVFE